MATAATHDTATTVMPRPAGRLRAYLELVRFSHTIFALPFAVTSALLAARRGIDPGLAAGPGGWLRPAAGILLCMVAARTAAMAFNRLVDRTIDAANPRTASRHLPRGDVGVAEVLGLVVAASAAFVAATLLYLNNRVPFPAPLRTNGWTTNLVLVLILVLFLAVVVLETGGFLRT